MEGRHTRTTPKPPHPSAARGNVTSWSPETKVILDSNAGDYFPSFMKLNGIDHLVLFGKSAKWVLLHEMGRLRANTGRERSARIPRWKVAAR